MSKRILFIFVLLILILVGTVSAETLTGTISGENWTSISFTQSTATSSTSRPINGLYTTSMAYTGNLKSVIQWNYGAGGFSTDTGAPSGAATPVTIRISNQTLDGTTHLHTMTNGRIVGTGTLGYQRVYNTAIPPVEQVTSGYIWLAMDSWDLGTETGAQYLYMDFDHNALYNITYPYYGGNGVIPTGYTMFTTASAENTARDCAGSNQLNNKDNSIYAQYTATKPAGVGITGSIIKSVGGVNYSAQGIIYSSTGTILTSESTQTVNTFNFSTTAEQIIIGIKDSAGNKYNSSLLFSVGGTIPTPTPTPTPTVSPGGGGPGSVSDVTMTFRNNLNSSVISGVYTELWYPNKVTSIQGYSDSNGQITFSEIPIGEVEVKAWKNGYQVQNMRFTPSPYVYSRTMYLIPDSTGGSVPAQINITLTVRNANGGAALSNVYVTAYDVIAGTTTRGGYTDVSGVVHFYGFPNTAYIEGSLSKAGYSTRSWSVDMQQVEDYSDTLYMAPLVTPTMTPVPFDTWTLTANPDSIALGDSSLLTFDCANETKESAAGGLRTVLYYEKDNLGPSSTWKLIGVYKYNTTSEEWDFRVNNNVPWDYGGYSPTELAVTPATGGDYDYQVAAFGVNSVPIATAETSLLIGGGGTSGSLTMSISAMDGSTMNHLQNYYLSLTDEVTDTTVDYGLISYEKSVNLPRGATFTASASKSGYENNTKTFVVPTDLNIQAGDFGAVVAVLLFPPGTTSAGNTTVTVMVDDAETYYPVGNVQISITGQTPKFTGPAGEGVSFILLQNTAYTVNAAKAGYCGSSESFNTSTNTYKYIPLYIKYGSCVGPTPTHTPIPNATPIVTTPTPIGGYGQINGTAAVCGELPEDASYIDILRNNLACNGFKDVLSQNMALSMLIILAAGIILGRVAGGVGVLSGVISGAVISMAMGFLPFWIIIVLIIVAGLIFAGKIFWSGGT